MDIWTKTKRSQVMSRILSRDTAPELRARSMLRGMGLRYRLNVKNLPGKPDIVLRKFKTIIFVHGCFWHSHAGCRDGTIPKTRISYWKNKLLRNKERDFENKQYLERMGWKVLRLWECDIENRPGPVCRKIKKILSLNSK